LHAAVEEFDDVEDFLAGAVDGGAAAQLQQAPGIGGDNGLGASGLGSSARSVPSLSLHGSTSALFLLRS
jgi:hypothetical protein